MSISWTLGSMMFYGGIAGFILTLISMVVAIAIGRASRKKIVRRLNEEYGGNLK